MVEGRSELDAFPRAASDRNVVETEDGTGGFSFRAKVLQGAESLLTSSLATTLTTVEGLSDVDQCMLTWTRAKKRTLPDGSASRQSCFCTKLSVARAPMQVWPVRQVAEHVASLLELASVLQVSNL